MAQSKRPRAKKGAPIFSWLHLSDIHVGQGDAAHEWDQQGMLREVIRDLKANTPGTLPRLDAIFVTGDIASWGGLRVRAEETSSQEYRLAAEWLREVAAAAGLGAERIFVIPGNHDVQRTTDRDRQPMRLLRELRNGQDVLDEALRDQTDRRMLSDRLQHYLAFAKEFAPLSLSADTQPEQWLYWTHAIDAREGFVVRLFGWNSALLCNDDHDAGRLYLNHHQLALLSTDQRPLQDIRIVLSHHPLKGEWLRNVKDARNAVRGRAHLVLSGHEHSANVRMSVEPGSSGLVEVFAGAIDPAQGEARDYTYNVGALYPAAPDSVSLRIWPRRWIASSQTYAEDVALTHRGATFYEQAIPEAVSRGAVVTAVEPPPLAPLAGVPTPRQPTWVVAQPSARAWLEQLGLADTTLLLRGKIVVADGPVLPRRAAPAYDESRDPWRVETIEQLVAYAREQSRTNVVPVLLHGLRGMGMTTLLLRYVAAAAPAGSVRLFLDCASNSDRSMEDARLALKSRLRREFASADTTTALIAIDGLDLCCRAQAVRDGEPNANLLLAPEAAEFLTLLRQEAQARSVVVVFTANDPPSLGREQDLVADTSWAVTALRPLVAEAGGVEATLVPSVTDVDAGVWSTVLPADKRAVTKLPPHRAAILELPLFFDALRDVPTRSIARLETRRDVLRLGAERARAVGVRRHSYYQALDALDDFLAALAALPLRQPSQPTATWRDCVMLIAAELTSEWIYLLPLSRGETAVRNRMQELRDWLAADTWRYSDTYALSNLVTALAFLGEKEPVGRQPYRHCNLRNVYIDDAAITGAQFHGVDLSGARVRGTGIRDARFYGVNLDRAEFDRSHLANCRFVGCSYSAATFSRSVIGDGVEFIEPVPHSRTPES